MPQVHRLHSRTLVASILVVALVACRDDSFRPSPDPLMDITPIPPEVMLAAGDIAQCGKGGAEATAKLLDALAGTVFTLGDNAYPDGREVDYTNCYHPTWGRHKARTFAALGNHEYNTGTADPSFDYYVDRAGERGKGYYSLDLGAWHIVVLNSGNSKIVPYSAGSAQERWLRADLAANTKPCVLAIWHHPRFFSANSSTQTASSPRALWVALYEYGAELVLNGHSHHYERFAPMNPDGLLQPDRGIREFIVGTGGQGTGLPSNVRENSEVRSRDFGILKLTLSDGGYSWQFVPIAGRTFQDAGSGTCHGVEPAANQPPTARPGGPYRSEALVSFDGTASSDPERSALTYAWDFGDGSTGNGARPTHAYSADGEYTVTLTVTDSLGLRSTPATTIATIANIAPTVNAGANQTAYVGEVASVNATFSDPGAADNPWGYSVDWGDQSAPEAGTTDTPANPITATHTYGALGQYTVRVTVTDKDGGVASDDLTVIVLEPGASHVLVGAGDIARCDEVNDEATANLLDGIPGTVFTAGDNAYPGGSDLEFTNCYHPSWGRHKDRTRPAPGDKDYVTAGAAGYFTYFGAVAGTPGAGYYSYDLGEWHIVVLNSNIAMSAGSAQEQWLRGDLAGTTKQCVLAYWHHPRFYSTGTSGVRASVKPLWDALYAAGAELVINGEARFYERFAPQTPDGVADLEGGIREIIVGTGGIHLTTFGTVRPNSEVRSNTAFGVLKLTLSAGSYAWEFVPVAGQAFTDAGTQPCH